MLSSPKGGAYRKGCGRSRWPDRGMRGQEDPDLRRHCLLKKILEQGREHCSAGGIEDSHRNGPGSAQHLYRGEERIRDLYRKKKKKRGDICSFSIP